MTLLLSFLHSEEIIRGGNYIICYMYYPPYNFIREFITKFFNQTETNPQYSIELRYKIF